MNFRWTISRSCTFDNTLDAFHTDGRVRFWSSPDISTVNCFYWQRCVCGLVKDLSPTEPGKSVFAGKAGDWFWRCCAGRGIGSLPAKSWFAVLAVWSLAETGYPCCADVWTRAALALSAVWSTTVTSASGCTPVTSVLISTVLRRTLAVVTCLPTETPMPLKQVLQQNQDNRAEFGSGESDRASASSHSTVRLGWTRSAIVSNTLLRWQNAGCGLCGERSRGDCWPA